VITVRLLFAALLVAGSWSNVFAAQLAQPVFTVEGVVKDQNGSAVVAALSFELPTRAFLITGSDGRFEFKNVPPGTWTLSVNAQGFAPAEKKITVKESDRTNLEITVEPAALSEQMTVTAARTETRVGDTAASIIVLGSEDLSTTAALTIDDALRQVPGFSLFRRSGSRTSNPTAQGVSLRGVGASGASRAVVLEDGLPLNDPFGGWVYWSRVPRESLSRIETVRGGASSLYGTDALGGVLNLITRQPREGALSLEASYGNQKTPDVSFFGGGQLFGWGATLAAEAFHTDGYVLVDERERGLVDTRAGAEHTTVDVMIERSFAEQSRFFVRGTVFGEDRANGTPLQQNRTHIRQLALGYDWRSHAVGAVTARTYGSAQVYDQDFSAIAGDRNSETLTRSQRVPAQQRGFMLQWSRPAGSAQTLVAGVDGRDVRGASDELVFAAGQLSSAVGAGGRQRSYGVFGEDIIRITPRWLVTLGARVDRWRNYDALSTTRPLAAPGPSTVRLFPDQSETAFSPRLALVHKLTDRVSLNFSAYRAFRAPTLNELYRAFRVGNVLTLANDKLRAERLTGGEAGASVNALNNRMNLRGTFFWSEITRPIANVTLSATPALITRQRQNLGRTRSRGLELEGEVRLSSAVVLSAGYEFVDATVLEFPATRSLEGLLIPQVPRHQFTFQGRYSNPRVVTFAVQGRAIGEQFDDDQNQLSLGRYFTLDAMVSRAVNHGVELFAAAENLFDQRYDVGRTPVRTLGPPILARFGIRVRIGGR
jgi:outer membrane receptor protein involved in Fe transport